MLVLSRKTDQSVRLPEVGVTVHVTGVSGRKVKLGFEAPPDVSIVRGERPAAAKPRAPGEKRDEKLEDIGDALHRLTLRLAVAEAAGDGPPALFAELYEQTERVARAVRGAAERPDERADEAEAPPFRPMTDEPPATDEPAGADAEAAPSRVLLVSDDAEERGLLATLLSSWGVAVDACDGPARAAARLRAAGNRYAPARYDLVLADLGEADLRDLRAAVNAGFERVRLLSLGFGRSAGDGLADEFLAKPVNPRALADRVRGTLLAP